jgi:hypothetical protein
MTESTPEIVYLQSINSVGWTADNAADHIVE